MNTDSQMIQETVASLKELGVEKMGLAHCIGEEAQQLFKDEF